MEPNDINQDNLKTILKENIMKRLIGSNEFSSQTITNEQIEAVAEEEIQALLSSLDNEMMEMIQHQIQQNEERKLTQRIIESKLSTINQFIN